jgi:hypothetical protein
MDSKLSRYLSGSGSDSISSAIGQFTMDDSDIGITDTPAESGVMTPETDMERQVASLKTYLDAMPYNCESVDEMQGKLEATIGKIAICARSRNWPVLSAWDGLLQWFEQFSLYVHDV